MPRPYFHVHHKVLMEFLTEPLQNRQRYIREEKPECQREVRLRLLRPVRGKLPPAVEQAWAAYRERWSCSRKSWLAYRKALRDYAPEIEALHKVECPNCPWDGKTIFPRKKKDP